MNWTRFVWMLKVMLGMERKAKLRSLDELIFIAGGNDYEWMNLDPDELCQAVVRAGGHGIGIEIGGHMKFHGAVMDYMPHYKKLIDKMGKLADACRFYGLWLKATMWNTNNPAGKRVTLNDLVGLTGYLKEKCSGVSNILLVPMSESSSETPANVRQAYIDYICNSGWPTKQTVLMEGDRGPALFREYHLQRPNRAIPFNHRAHFFVVTDSWPTESGSVDHGTMMRMATEARSKGLSFHEYGFEEKMPVQDWKAIGKLYA